MEDKSYLGTGWSFPPSFAKGTGAGMASDEEDIKQSLRILFSTTPGERIFRFDYGCNIRKWVFERQNLSSESLIIDCIKQAILCFEPRIAVDKVRLETRDELEGIFWIHLDYTIHQTNNRGNMVYPFYIKEGTNL